MSSLWVSVSYSYVDTTTVGAEPVLRTYFTFMSCVRTISKHYEVLGGIVQDLDLGGGHNLAPSIDC
jgi:hypothetical protein